METVPSGVEIIIDGISYGDSPVTVDSMDFGDHRIALIPSASQRWGIQSLDTLLTVDQDTDTLLLRLPGTIHITSSPRGCLITEGDRPIGYTPILLSRHPEAEIRLTAGAPDYLPYTWSWSPLAGTRTHMHVSPIRFDADKSPESGNGIPERLLYLGALAVSLAGGSILCSHEADRAYDRYKRTAHPAEISHLYDRAVLLDRCAGVFWIGFQLTIAGGIAWWLLE